MKFSIIVPTYNRCELLKQTLASVEAQTFRDFELIVVDDGSTDGTLDYLRSVNCRVTGTTNAGPSTARNLGARQATGDYLAFLDSDDLWYPWTLTTFAKVIDQENAIILGACLNEFTGEPRAVHESQLKAESFGDFLETARDPLNTPAGGMVVDRRLFLHLRGFDESLRIHEDTDFYLRAGTSGPFARIRAPVTLGYRIHPDNSWTNNTRNCLAIKELLRREATGHYPGGSARRNERRALITRSSRPASLDALKAGRKSEAWQLYLQTLSMNARLGRFKYLLGFPARGLRA